MGERRFTDREVGRILQRATEMDRDQGDAGALRPAGRGHTLAQLQEVGEEAGIPATLVARAAADVDRSPGLRPGALLGPDTRRRATRSVPGPLSREALGALVRLVDDRVPAQGTAVEALGAVRWTARGRLLSRQVTLEPSAEETLIRVEERHETRVPLLVQGLPVAYGAMAAGVLSAEVLSGLPAVAAALGLTGAAWAVGRVVWEALSARSAARVHDLAEDLAEEAARLSAEDRRRAGGPVVPDAAGEAGLRRG